MDVVDGRERPVSWLLVEPSSKLAEAVGLPSAPLPVRADRVERIFGERVDLLGLVDEIEAFVGEQPDQFVTLEPSIVRLYDAAIDDLLDTRNFELAEQLALRGLAWAPDSPSLRVQLGRAQHGLGRHAEATLHWSAVVAEQRASGHWSPMLWILTARALDEMGHPAAALDLLDDVADLLPDGRDFWDLRGAIAERAEAAPS